MINIFGEEEFKPVVRYQREIPGYYVSMDGRIYSEKTNMIRSGTKNNDYNSTGKKRLKNLKVGFDIPIGHYPDYSYRKRRETDKTELMNFVKNLSDSKIVNYSLILSMVFIIKIQKKKIFVCYICSILYYICSDISLHM